ncbi:magnesium transporter [Natronospirillum operosum]|uniref:Magnesium transporter MgtE n=1 Tax=Natronospirillum operosum TaxID=2759953 RepID=A0A4Z0WBE7_9GAMM|nr:magnesium transporter [Natronospirillum operosum]TGG91992.1 magnesium transporter [Natronospirillum operosum]
MSNTEHDNTPVQHVLNDLIAQELWEEVPAQLDEMHVQDIATVLDDQDNDTAVRILKLLAEERQLEVFSYLKEENQYAVLDAMDNAISRKLLQSLSSDDLTRLLEALKPEQSEPLLKLLTSKEVKAALKILGYPEQSAGRLMNTEFVTIRPDWTVREVLQHVRSQDSSEETINTLYITDEQGHLLGTAGIKRMVLSDPDTPVETMISSPLVSVQASDDREEAVHQIQHYDINALPVLSKQGILLGVVTVDDVMDVIEEEATEDFHKMGGTSTLNLSLRDARPSLLYRKRVGWLVLLVFMNIFGGAGIAYFEETIEAVIALVFFLPLIVDSGGNAGSQSATLMVRALATGDVRSKDWLRLWGKELGVAIALGITMGLAVWGLGIWRGGPEVGLVVAMAMVCVVTFGSMVGMVLPFVLARMKFDPATASAPLITSIADICGILIYFSIATAVLTI